MSVCSCVCADVASTLRPVLQPHYAVIYIFDAFIRVYSLKSLQLDAMHEDFAESSSNCGVKAEYLYSRVVLREGGPMTWLGFLLEFLLQPSIGSTRASPTVAFISFHYIGGG